MLCPYCKTELEKREDGSYECPNCKTKIKPLASEQTAEKADDKSQSEANEVEQLKKRIATLEENSLQSKVKKAAGAATTYVKGNWKWLLPVVLAVLLFIILMVSFVGLRGIYVNVNDPNDFMDFGVSKYTAYSTDELGQAYVESGKYTLSGSKLTLKVKDSDFGDLKEEFAVRVSTGYNSLKLILDGDEVIEYKRVSIVGYKTTAEKVTVTFDPCNGQDPKKFKVKIGSSLGREIDAPANGSQRFLGWYNERNGSRSETAMAYKKDLRIWEDTTFYASWPFEVDENGVLYQVDKNGIGEELRIPANVRSIGENVFADCTQITSVFIPATVQEIQFNAFSGCTNIVSATAPGNLLSSFHYLQSAYVNGGSLTGSQSFSDSLKDLQISIYVTDIDLSNIRMNALERISVDFGNPNWTSNDGILYKASDKSIAYVPKAIKGAISILDGCTGIGRHAFYSSSGLQTVTIPSSVTSIGESAFYNCYRITRVNYLGDLKGWCEIDFGNGSANPLNATDDAKLYVKENGGDREVTGAINIPVGTTKIGAYAFYEFDTITSVTIPESVTSIGNYAFDGCTNLKTFIVAEGNLAYQSKDGVLYKKADKSIYLVPSAIEGAVAILDGCTSIGDNVFNGRTGLSEITIPDSVTNIGNSAFSGCTNIITATFPAIAINSIPKTRLNTVTITSGDIPREAFRSCTNLQTVTIGAGVTSIGEEAFSDCTGLQTVTIGNSVTSIGRYAFYNCRGLQVVTIGEGVESIENSAFSSCTSITTATMSANAISYIPKNNLNTVTITSGDIPREAFKSCTSLQTVTIESGSIGGSAFYGCTGLQTVTIGSGVTSIGGDAFRNCTGLQMVNWNATNCTTVGSSSFPIFRGCTGLATVNIGDNVESIPECAFNDYTGLQTVTIGAGVKSIGNYAFYDCTGITRINYLGDLKGWCEIEFGDSSANPLYAPNDTKSGTAKLYVQENGGEKEVAGEVNIPVGTTKIGKYAFYNLTGITSVTIPESVSSVSSYAFSGCTGITMATIPAIAITSIPKDNLNTVTITSGDIPSSTFYRCTSLQTVTIGSGVTSIGKDAFSGCTGITRVNYLGDLKGWCEIGFGNYSANPLYYADNAKLYVKENGVEKEVAGEVNIPVGTTKIGDSAFYGLKGITSVTIPDSVTSIGWTAFRDCTGLQTVTIGSGVTSIAYSAFSDCTGITRVNYLGDLKGWCEIEFGSSSANPLTSKTKLYVKENGKEKEVAGDINIPDGTTKIGDYVFLGLTGMTSVNIPDSVTSIGDGAFNSCTNLQTVTIGAGVKSIGNSAFYNCTGLKDIYYAGDETQWGQITKAYSWAYGLSYQMHYNSTGPSAAASAEDAEYDEIARLFAEVEALRCTDEGKHAIAA